VCRKCGKSGHFAKVCKTKLFTTGKVNPLNQYFEEESDQEIFMLSGKDDAIISIEIEGQSINCLIDSGSYINAIDKQTFEKLKTRKSMLEKTTIKIFPYGSSKPIPLVGNTKMNATVNNETCAIEFHVIAGNGKPLLGRKSTTELKYYADKRMSNDFEKYRIGQNVNLLRREESKMSSRYEDKPYKVVRQRGTSVMLRSNNGHIIYRNVSHVRPYFTTFERNIHCDNRQHIVRARPHRLRKMPDKCNDFAV
jgi:translation elongation factor P/translation initiation factor 5A